MRGCLDFFELKLVPTRRNTTCAVVGSSDILRIFPMGAHIDHADLVWRVNHAPTRGFETLVGQRTDLRLLNHVTTDIWKGRLHPKEGEFRGKGDEFSNRSAMCLDSVCISMASRELLNIPRIMPPHCNRVSTGMFTVAAALRACPGIVSLYGFYPDCCRANLMYPGINYKYYHTNRSAWVCCSRGREDMSWEYKQYIRHPRLRVHIIDVRQGTAGMPTCAVVGSAWTRRRFGARIDAANVVYRVNHAPTKGFESMVGSRTDVRTLGDGTLDALRRGRIKCTYTTCVFIRKYGDLSKYAAASDARLAPYNASISIAPNEFTRYLISFKAQYTTKTWRTIKVSGGLASTMFALERCSRVDVYMMEYRSEDSCCVRRSPYNYYESDVADRARCCTHDREGDDEHRAWRELPSESVHIHSI